MFLYRFDCESGQEECVCVFCGSPGVGEPPGSPMGAPLKWVGFLAGCRGSGPPNLGLYRNGRVVTTAKNDSWLLTIYSTNGPRHAGIFYDAHIQVMPSSSTDNHRRTGAQSQSIWMSKVPRQHTKRKVDQPTFCPLRSACQFIHTAVAVYIHMYTSITTIITSPSTTSRPPSLVGHLLQLLG